MEKTYKGFNQGNIQNMNRALLLNLLRREGVCARARLAELSELKQATITYIMNDFIRWGLVREVGFLTGSKGRRSIGISINNDLAVVGIRIARKNYSVGLFELSGNAIIIRRVSIELEQSARETFESIIALTDELIKNAKDRRVLAIGMALPGPYSIKRGRIELMTGVSGWNEIMIEEEMKCKFHIPIFIEQDANAGAIAQYWYNKEEELNQSVLVYIAVGQGVGAGIMSNGQLLKGNIGVAGEIGHTTIDVRGVRCACGNYGCLENYCSTIALTRQVNAALKAERNLSFSEVAILVREENPIAVRIMKQCCEYLATGLVNVINSFNPQVLIIGDELSHIIPDKMLEWVTENVKKRVLPEIFENTRIMMSVVEQDSMVHGAAIVAIREIFSHVGDYFEDSKAL